MNKLSKSQYIGVAVALVIAGFMFFGLQFIYSLISNNQTTQMANQELQKQISAEGTGDIVAEKGDSITVNYLGTYANGTKFDSSYDRGVPFTFTLGIGKVIQGWDQGLIGSKVGEKLQLTIPASLGYGEDGVPDGRGGYAIPPAATLIFQVEVLKIEKAQ